MLNIIINHKSATNTRRMSETLVIFKTIISAKNECKISFVELIRWNDYQLWYEIIMSGSQMAKTMNKHMQP